MKRKVALGLAITLVLSIAFAAIAYASLCPHNDSGIMIRRKDLDESPGAVTREEEVIEGNKVYKIYYFDYKTNFYVCTVNDSHKFYTNKTDVKKVFSGYI